MYTVGRFNRGLAAALLAFLSLLSVADAQTGSDTAVAATACGGAYQNPVVTENCSTPSSSWTTAWRVDRGKYTYDPKALAGYASATSVAAGGLLHFYVWAEASYRVDIYRLGYYGGAGGRLVQSVAAVAATRQPACAWIDGGSPAQYYSCAGWHNSYDLSVPSNWVSGIYIAALTSTTTGAGGQPYQAHIVFAVRHDGRAAQFYFQQAIATEQAYNNAVGPGLYVQTNVNGHKVPIAKASFDRPYDALDNLQIYRFEAPFIYFIESQGYDVTYGTDIDTHEGVAPLSSYRAVLAAGHSEYWSKPMYDAAVAARDAGVNLGFFSGNTLYTQMRLEATAASAGDGTHGNRDRVIVVYRHAYPPQANGLGDPNPDPRLQTIRWRAFPVLRDQEQLIGVHYTTYLNCAPHTAAWASAGRAPTTTQPQSAPYLLADPQPLIVAAGSHWAYAGTGLTTGASVPGVNGQEADSYEKVSKATCGPNSGDPPPVLPTARLGSLVVLADSPFDHIEGSPGNLVSIPTGVHVHAVIYQACSGAFVFSAGSVMWPNALAPSNILGKNYSQPTIQKMTQNLLDAFARRIVPPSSTGACRAGDRPLIEAITPLLLDDDPPPAP